MWERTLQDLIRGLRANKNDESKFIAQAIEEIRREVRSKDMELKAAAILKMTFLDMLGYDLSWADFNIIEVMSSTKYHLKTVGYLAASQSFSERTDVLMLTTNLLKKDLSSNPADVALALNGLSHFVTPDLARDLTQELNAMLNHSRAHIRKRVILALFKVIQQHPETLPFCLPRLIEKLDDPDFSVVSSTVNLFCELSRRNPQDFLSLAPPLFHILTTSSNNWMLIKVIKLFGAISPYEPRLAKKLQGPITDLIQTTAAISLLYECVHTCIIGGMLDGSDGLALARLCVNKLSTFLENDDQNLKYIALMAMVKIVPVRPELVAEHQAVILSSLDDLDMSIRMRALELISSMVTPYNLQYLVQQLLSHLVKANQTSSTPSAQATLAQALQSDGQSTSGISLYTPAYRQEISSRIIDMCSRNMYENVQDFDWYLSVLLDLIYIANVDIAAMICDQLVNVAVRVRASRAYAVQLMAKLLDDDGIVLGANDPTKCTGVLWAAAWICGEYSETVLTRLIQPSISLLSSDIIAVYIQATLKVLSRWTYDLAEGWSNEQLKSAKETVDAVLTGLNPLCCHADMEVQERAANAAQLVTLIHADLSTFQPKPFVETPQQDAYLTGFEDPTPQTNDFPKSLLLLRRFFNSYKLRPVAVNANKQVPIPAGLNLDSWITAPPKRALDEDVRERKKKKKSKKGKEKAESTAERVNEGLSKGYVEYNEDEEEAAQRRAERLARQRDDPYYLTDAPKSKSVGSPDVDSIPVVRLEGMPSLSALTPPRPSSRLSDVQPPPAHKHFELDRDEETPAHLAVASSPATRPGTPLTEAEIPSGLETPDAIVVKRAKKKGTGKRKTPVPPL
ncbi:related to Adapter-related protein complex 3 delta 1 subunit [Serendipita indica DSM 11827]|uniref:AP-3 complex subunit delta n=1 Tax=Serendipita indica (strain DSM 11827) TaxID=1109443 RepID=G4TBL0_SERID|nr:related to Adapter-related protein complex 3 delta 1 subunit [Serendipita indica DSM 11827]